MGFFTFILCFLILLIVLIVIGSAQQLALLISTKKKNEFVVMLIPALCSLILFSFTIIITHILLNTFDINDLDIIYSIFMKWEYNFNNYIITIMAYIACVISFVLLQGMCLKLVNIDYKKISDFIKYKIFRKKEVKGLTAPEGDGKVSIDLAGSNLPVMKAKISYFYYFTASLFTFALLFFSILLFIYIGILIGQKYIL